MMKLCFMPLSIVLGAALNTKRVFRAIAQYSNLSPNFLLLAKDPATLKIANELVCLQMIISEPTFQLSILL
jgi:hypothetical protein